MTDADLLSLVHEEADLPRGHELWEDAGFLFGVDSGQRQDHSAVAVVQRFLRTAFIGPDGSEVSPVSLELRRRDGYTLAELGIHETRIAAFQLRDLFRWPLMTEYPRIVADVLRAFRRTEVQGLAAQGRVPARPAPTLVLDAGGSAAAWPICSGNALT